MDRVVYTKSGQIDGELLPFVQDRARLYQTEQQGEYIFDVVQLMGSHGKYNLRYPEAFKRFSARDITDRPNLTEEQRQAIAEYLNTIYYNDYIVSEIIQANQDIPSIIIYLSDHGEALFDLAERPNYTGHYLSVGGATIPMMVYVSPSLREAEPKLWDKVKLAQDKPFMSDLLPFSVMGLLGIEAPFYQEKYDLFSPNYDSQRVRYVHQGKDQKLRVKHSLVNPEKVIRQEVAIIKE